MLIFLWIVPQISQYFVCYSPFTYFIQFGQNIILMKWKLPKYTNTVTFSCTVFSSIRSFSENNQMSGKWSHHHALHLTGVVSETCSLDQPLKCNYYILHLYVMLTVLCIIIYVIFTSFFKVKSLLNHAKKQKSSFCIELINYQHWCINCSTY